VAIIDEEVTGNLSDIVKIRKIVMICFAKPLLT
jgi:hypothetical protein